MQFRSILLATGLILSGAGPVFGAPAYNSGHHETLAERFEHFQTIPPAQCLEEIRKEVMENLPKHRAYLEAQFPGLPIAPKEAPTGTLTSAEDEWVALVQDVVCRAAKSAVEEEGRGATRKRAEIDLKPAFTGETWIRQRPSTRPAGVLTVEDIRRLQREWAGQRRGAEDLTTRVWRGVHNFFRANTAPEEAPTFVGAMTKVIMSIVIL